MVNSNPERLLNRLVESSDIYIGALSHVLGQSIDSPIMSSGLLHDKMSLVQEWRDNWASLLNELASIQ